MPRKKKRSDGRYRKVFRFNGKQYAVYGKDSSDAEAKKVEKLEMLKNGVTDYENPTVDKYYDEIFTVNRRGQVKESTIRSQICQYRNCADMPVGANGKRFGSLRIRDVTPKDVQKVQKELEKTNRTTETINNCMDHLKHVFNAAVDDETIDRNPCRALKRLVRSEPVARDTLHRALTVEETRKFFAEAENSFYLNHFKLMIQTGLRIGELCALKYSDIDEGENCIHVTKTVTRLEDGSYVIGDSTKTYAGLRDIPLNAEIKSIVGLGVKTI